MQIKRIKLKNFRCFTDHQFDIDGQFILIEGKNGSGKTSLLEALHYSCYLRSFRTHTSRDLVHLDENNFFIQIDIELEDFGAIDQVQIGYSEKDGKLVKFNQKPIQSYKELITHYRIVSLTADDVEIVSGSPDERREFLNYSLLLENPAILQNLKRYKHILEQRNSILHKRNSIATSFDELQVWTKKLWEDAQIIQHQRIIYLTQLQDQVNALLRTHFAESDVGLEIAFNYHIKNMKKTESFDEFWHLYLASTRDQELRWGRTMFGAHLDDFAIIFQKKRARIFASRGQQKLIVFLIKIAQLQRIGLTGVLLLDDFLTDFDDNRIQTSLSIVTSLPFQTIITSPCKVLNLFKMSPKNKIGLIEL